ncbi:tRNA 2-selenouridine(34) synthase MnmH [Neobacillus sp. D3-1R]|uniref:tRNA 2-selenouridine(34) synthase MnmH n=1 Tax=Neobacillus sp. D3-1R TaxID=3445778 RepID=UPI003F9F84F9
MLKEISVEEFIKLAKAVAIDVRSPIEFKEGSIPGAINLPLFSDEERSEIGTIYKQQGQEKAKWRAMEIVSPKIPYLMSEVKKLQDKSTIPVIHCWRGGMRSKAVATFMEYAGLPSLRLTGGYKSYRQYILDKTEELLPNKAIVLHGKTGVGKTAILHQLQSKGYPVLDLEGIAGHRGSIFGSIGIGEGNSQKNFDALLFSELEKLKDFPYIIMEAESKRIGRVVQPQGLLKLKENGHHLYLELPIATRVDHIMDEYVYPFKTLPWFKDKVQTALEKIEKRMKDSERRLELNQSFLEENWPLFIKVLLEDYYDPRYDHKKLEYAGNFVMFEAEDINQAVTDIEKYLIKLNVPTAKAVLN